MLITAADQPHRALVVDDDGVLRTALEQFITRLGFAVQGADNGRHALALFQAQAADIVLLDAAMPVMDGFAACEAIRALPAGRYVPVIMITSYADEDSVDRAFRSGATEYVTKPIHWAVLRNRVRQLVAAADAERRLRQDGAFFQSLVDAMPDPTLVCDREGVVRWINQEAARNPLVAEAAVAAPLRLAPGVSESGGGESDPAAILARIRTHLANSDTPLGLLLHRVDPVVGEVYAEVHARDLRGVEGVNFGLILRLQDVTARELEDRRLRRQVTRFGELAHRDSLTGLTNRRRFEDLLNEAVAAAGRTGERLAVMFLDLDGFKGINDTRGHAAGDRVLCEVAARLQLVVRRPDTVSRLGGDEFAILLRDAPPGCGVLDLGERLLTAICAPIVLAEGPATIDATIDAGIGAAIDATGDASLDTGRDARIGASIGVSLFPEHGSDGATLLRCADEAMYAVKSRGKRGVAIATG